MNFTLQVGGANTVIEVSEPVDTLLAVSSSSVGEVINQQRVGDLPTSTNNVLDIYRLIPGIRIDDTSNSGSVSGLGGLGTVNITRDGVDNVGAARFGGSLGGRRMVCRRKPATPGAETTGYPVAQVSATAIRIQPTVMPTTRCLAILERTTSG